MAIIAMSDPAMISALSDLASRPESDVLLFACGSASQARRTLKTKNITVSTIACVQNARIFQAFLFCPPPYSSRCGEREMIGESGRTRTPLPGTSSIILTVSVANAVSGQRFQYCAVPGQAGASISTP